MRECNYFIILRSFELNFIPAFKELIKPSNVKPSENKLEEAKIAEKANAVLKQIAEQRKIDVIVQEAAFVSPKSDITDDVIKALNSQK